MIKLHRHQELILAYMEANDAFAIFAEQGTGKTLPALKRIDDLILEGEVERALIVGPKATIKGWQRQMGLLGEQAEARLKEHTTVLNYDIVWRRPELLETTWDIVILDESHYIKTRSSKRTRFCIKLGMNAKYRYILTGTPIANKKMEEIYSQFVFLAPEKRPNTHWIASEWLGNWSEFSSRYFLVDKWGNPWKYLRVAELQEIINEHSYRVLKEDCLDLPDKLPDEQYDIELKEKAMYKELHKDSVIMEYEMVAENALAKMTKLRQLCSGFLVDNQGVMYEKKCEKAKILCEYLDGREGQKTVIFCEYRYSIDQVAKLLDKRKQSYLVLDGRQADKGIWQQFQSDPSIEIMICQYQSGNAGIDLYASDTIIFYEPTLSSTTLSQAKDRIHRIGQNKKCSYIHFITEGTVEEAIYKSLLQYEDFGKKLFEEYLDDYQKGYYKR